MQIFFIRNKVDRKIVDNRKKYLDEISIKKHHSNMQIMLTIFLCEIIATLFITYICKKHIFDIEIYKKYYVDKIVNKSINSDKYIIYLFMKYFKEIALILVFNFTKYKRIFNYLYLVYKSIILSLSFAIFIIIYGLEGQYKFILTLFPQGLIFYGYIVFFIIKSKNIIFSKKEYKKIVFYLVFSIVVSYFTAFFEAKFNLKILYKII